VLGHVLVRQRGRVFFWGSSHVTKPHISHHGRIKVIPDRMIGRRLGFGVGAINRVICARKGRFSARIGIKKCAFGFFLCSISTSWPIIPGALAIWRLAPLYVFEHFWFTFIWKSLGKLSRILTNNCCDHFKPPSMSGLRHSLVRRIGLVRPTANDTTASDPPGHVIGSESRRRLSMPRRSRWNRFRFGPLLHGRLAQFHVACYGRIAPCLRSARGDIGLVHRMPGIIAENRFGSLASGRAVGACNGQGNGVRTWFVPHRQIELGHTLEFLQLLKRKRDERFGARVDHIRESHHSLLNWYGPIIAEFERNVKHEFGDVGMTDALAL